MERRAYGVHTVNIDGTQFSNYSWGYQVMAFTVHLSFTVSVATNLIGFSLNNKFSYSDMVRLAFWERNSVFIRTPDPNKSGGEAMEGLVPSY